MTVIAASAPMTVARSNVAGGQTSRPVPYRAPDTHPEQFSDVIAVLTFHSRWRARGAMVADPPERQRSTQFTARGLHRICCFFDHAFALDLVDRGFRPTRWEMASPASRRSQSFGMVGESRNENAQPAQHPLAPPYGNRDYPGQRRRRADPPQRRRGENVHYPRRLATPSTPDQRHQRHPGDTRPPWARGCAPFDTSAGSPWGRSSRNPTDGSRPSRWGPTNAPNGRSRRHVGRTGARLRGPLRRTPPPRRPAGSTHGQRQQTADRSTTTGRPTRRAGRTAGTLRHDRPGTAR